MDADAVLARALGRQAEETKRVPYRGQVAPPADDVTQQLQRPARYPVGGGALPHRGLDLLVVHQMSASVRIPTPIARKRARPLSPYLLSHARNRAIECIPGLCQFHGNECHTAAVIPQRPA